VRFAAANWQEVEIAIRPRDEAVNAGSDEDRYCYRKLLTAGANKSKRSLQFF
jgi:hypothetical protein